MLRIPSWGRLFGRRQPQLVRTDSESGQALVVFAAGLVIFLGLVALSIDVGRLVWARTHMQAAVDSAALAAAQSMPDELEAQDMAEAYWDDNSGFLQAQGNNVSFVVTYPEGNKAISVRGDAEIPTFFAKFFGVPHWNVWAEGDAESQVLDIAVVLDISGSMCYDPPEVLHVENTESALMSPGRNTSLPKLVNSIPAGGGDTITIELTSVAIFNSTSSSTNNTNFGYSNSNRYHQQSIGGRAGTILIHTNTNGTGSYELFDITAVSGAANTITVTRARPNNFTGASTSKIAHPAGAEVWANRQGCDKAGRTASGPYHPFDGAIDNAKYFTTLFDSDYDKIGLASYDTTADNLEWLSSNFAAVRTEMDGIPNPNGSTNIAHGLSKGREILNGPNKRANAVRVLVLLTDGIPNYYCTNSGAYNNGDACNTGSSATSPTSCAPLTTGMQHAIAQAAAAAAQDIKVYAIGLGNGVLDCVLEQVAAAGDGTYYKAPTVAQLDEAFDAIAEQTHIALVR